MTDISTGLPYLRELLENHSIFTRLTEDNELVFLNTQLKGLRFLFDYEEDFVDAEYVSEDSIA